MIDQQSPAGVPQDLFEAYKNVGQEHVFRFWDGLSGEERDALVGQLREIDLDLVAGLVSGDLKLHAAAHVERTPPSVIELGDELPDCSRSEATERGWELLKAGKVGIFLVAGGQGTRLGYSGPKGCLEVGPLTGKSLFQLHAEKILALNKKCGQRIPWYIMTSAANDTQTRAFFQEHEHFGLPKDAVIFFQQKMAPALDDDGKLILQSTSKVFLAPDGHGGAFAAFCRGGGLADAQSRGIEHIFYFQVDNAIIVMADPVFMGFHDAAGSEMSLKVVRKTGPEEKVGVVALENGLPQVVEYSDLSNEEAERREPDGQLTFWSGNLAIHAFQLSFLQKGGEGGFPLPYHEARKKIPTVDAQENTIEIQGTKHEQFIFDALPHTKTHLNFEVERSAEFSPVKNRTGVDSLETAQAMLVEEHRRWLEAAGVKATGKVEISALAALSAEDLKERLVDAKPSYDGDLRIEPGEDGKARVVE